MRKIFSFMLVSLMIVLNFSAPPSFSEEQTVQWETAPLSPAFIEWRNNILSRDSASPTEDDQDTEEYPSEESSYIPVNKSLPDSEEDSPENSPEYYGHIPFPVDLSHLADDLPRDEDTSGLAAQGIFYNKASASDSKYDLRDYGLITSIKNQSPYETCWAFSSIAAMESNFLKQGYSELDLSEMHLAYFTFTNATKSKAFGNISGNFKSAMNHGGNSLFSTALYSRLDGPVLDSAVPYGENQQPSSTTPESYTRVLRLKDAYYLSMSSPRLTVNESDAQRTIVKQRIIDNGGVVASYFHKDSDYYTTSSNGTAYYNKTTGSTNHAVLLVGWNDSYSRSNFKTNPGVDGAWLVKNSWGTSWGTNGYFWISYANYLAEGTAFVVEQANSDLKAYYYDALGWCQNWGTTAATDMYAANAFQATRDGEKLVEVGFYTPVNNMSYTIYVYTGLGTSMPSSSPTGGTLAATKTGTIAYAGYHSIALNSSISLTKNQYFSVIVKYAGQQMIPVESKVNGFSNNASIETGSFFSINGTSWNKGTDSKNNATIKAFTTSSAGDTKPTISTASLSDGALNASYSAVLSAYGKTPITWSVSSGSMPTGLTLAASTGIISGTPTVKGDYSFTVKASNTLGTDSKTFTITISDTPTITTTALTGYVGYAMDETLSLSANLSATWTIDSLPKGLKFNTSTGTISGKPSKAGTYSTAVTAATAAGTASGTLTFTINAKPVKVSISTSKLPQITIGDSVNQTLSYKGTEPVTFEVTEGMPDGLTFDADTATFSGTPTEAGTFTIKVTGSNIVNTLTGKDPTVKKIKFVIKAKAPVIDEPESLGTGVVGEEYSGYQMTLSEGTLPVTWKAAGLPKGLTISSDGTISGTPAKAGTFSVKITAKNNGGSDTTGKIPLVVYAVPEITAKKLKDGTTDKKYSVKVNIKNTPIVWNVAGLPDTLAISHDKKGNLLITGTPTSADEYSVTITVANNAGSDSVTLPLTVKGVLPKITAKFPKGKVDTDYTGTITVTGTKPMTISYDIKDTDIAKHGVSSLSDLGLVWSQDAANSGKAEICGTPTRSVKGLPVYISAENPVSEAQDKTITKKITLTIAGDKPVFSSPSGNTITLSGTVNTVVSQDFTVTGTPPFTWTIEKSTLGFFVESTDTYSARMWGTVPPAKSGKTNFTITVKNADGKAAKKVVVQNVTAGDSAVSEYDGAMPEDWQEDTAELQEDSGTEETPGEETEAKIFAEVRDSGSLTQGELEALGREGYTLAAVLPEVRVTQSGLYDLEAEIFEEIETGAEMFWIAFPDSEGSEDDEIAEFTDEDGQEVTVVPESRKVNVSVWLREGVTYRPVIAVQ
ncbi:MAG: putative Ig domain-containing protein [Synergistaceae bacterium]|nr:putative Ig domain-containing protein [Synergistaceae bacterium]